MTLDVTGLIASFIEPWRTSSFADNEQAPWHLVGNIEELLRQQIANLDSSYQRVDELAVHHSARIDSPTIPPRMCFGFIPINGKVSSDFIVVPCGFRDVLVRKAPVGSAISAQVRPGATVVFRLWLRGSLRPVTGRAA